MLAFPCDGSDCVCSLWALYFDFWSYRAEHVGSPVVLCRLFGYPCEWAGRVVIEVECGSEQLPYNHREPIVCLLMNLVSHNMPEPTLQPTMNYGCLCWTIWGNHSLFAWRISSLVVVITEWICWMLTWGEKESVIGYIFNLNNLDYLTTYFLRCRLLAHVDCKEAPSFIAQMVVF